MKISYEELVKRALKNAPKTELTPEVLESARRFMPPPPPHRPRCYPREQDDNTQSDH